MNTIINKPTAAFVGASWSALLVGTLTYLIGLWNSEMQLNEKGYYFVIILFGLFASVSLQKSIRDRVEGIAVSHIYYSICWFSMLASILLLVVGLWNAELLLSEKGYFAMSYILSLYAAISVQKNIRDLALCDEPEPSPVFEDEAFITNQHD